MVLGRLRRGTMSMSLPQRMQVAAGTVAGHAGPDPATRRLCAGAAKSGPHASRARGRSASCTSRRSARNSSSGEAGRCMQGRGQSQHRRRRRRHAVRLGPRSLGARRQRSARRALNPEARAPMLSMVSPLPRKRIGPRVEMCASAPGARRISRVAFALEHLCRGRRWIGRLKVPQGQDDVISRDHRAVGQRHGCVAFGRVRETATASPMSC